MKDLSKKRPYRDFICGCGAASIEMVITFPLNKLIFRQQLLNITANQAVLQIRSEGLRYLYRGLLSPLCQKASARALMFGMYDRFMIGAGCPNGNGKHRFAWCHALCALMAGTSEAVLMPFERVQVLMQSQHYHNHFRNTLHAFGAVGQFGVREYYRGLTAVLLRNGPCNILFFGLRHPIHDRVVQLTEKLSRHKLQMRGAGMEFYGHFLAGSILGATISTLAFPINVVKTRMQSKLGGDFQTVAVVFRSLLNERGQKLRTLFRGVHLNYTRSLVTWGLTNSLYELLKQTLFNG